VAISEFEGALNRRDGGFGHAEDRVTATQIVPGDRAIGEEAHEPSVDLECATIKAAFREIIRVNSQRVGVKRVAFENSAEEFEFEVELALLAES